MHLAKLVARNFRLLENFEMEFRPDVTILVGPNYAGKSTIIETLLFLRDIFGSGQLFPMLGNRGNFAGVASSHDPRRHINLEIELTKEGRPAFFYKLEFAAHGVTHEQGQADGKVVCEVKLLSSEIVEVFTGGARSQITRNINASLLCAAVPAFASLRHFFSSVVNVDPFRNVNVQNQVGHNAKIATNGADLAQVLHYHHNNDREKFDAYVAAVTRVLQDVEMVETPIVGGQATTVSIRFRGSPAKFELASLSSGIREVMVLLAAAHFSQPECLLLLEEPENHLHPAAQKSLCAVLQELAHAEQKQFVVTTHSEFILGQFAPAQGVFVDRSGSGSLATPLDKVDAYLAWQRLGMDRNRLLEVLGRVRQVVVITEARSDAKIVEALAREDSKASDKVLPARAEGGGWTEIIERAAQLRDVLARFRIPSAVFVLLDNDGKRDQKLDCLRKNGFDLNTSHVWHETEIESYLLLPDALTAISGQEKDQVENIIAQAKGTGKARLEWVLDQLGIAGIPLDVIITNACRNSPDEMPAELGELVQSLHRLLG